MKRLKIIFKGYNWEPSFYTEVLSETESITKTIEDNFRILHQSVSYSPTTASLVESKYEINIEEIEKKLDDYIISYIDTSEVFYITVMKPKWED